MLDEVRLKLAARSNNIAITLARLKLPPARIKKAILEVNDDLLGVDDLTTLARMLPTPEAVRRPRSGR
jgi:hypothetical protein